MANNDEYGLKQEEGSDETYTYGPGYSITGARSDIIGRIDEYRAMEYFTQEDKSAYDQLIDLAQQKGYISQNNVTDLKSYMPVSGIQSTQAGYQDPVSIAVDRSISTNGELSSKDATYIVDSYARYEVDSILSDTSGDYDDETKKILQAAYDEKYGTYNSDYYDNLPSASSMSGEHMSAQAAQDAEERLGDFHFSMYPFIQAIGRIVDIDSKVSTARGLLSSIEAPSKGYMEASSIFDVEEVANMYYDQYDFEIDTYLSTLKDAVSTAKESVTDLADTTGDFNEEIFNVAQDVAAYDSSGVFAANLKAYFEQYSEYMIKGLESGAISFDLGQFVETMSRYLDGDVGGLQISQEESDLLKEVIKSGLSEIDYENSSQFEKLVTEAGIAVVGFGEGILNKIEGIVDGGITIVGGVVATPAYLASAIEYGYGNVLDMMGYSEDAKYLKDMSSNDLAVGNNIMSGVRKVVGYDASAAAFDFATSGLNQYAVQNTKVRKIANTAGGLVFDAFLGAYGGNAAVWINAVANTGKFSEKAANTEGLSDQGYYMAVADAAFGNFLFADLGQKVKAMKPKELSDYIDKAGLATVLGGAKGVSSLQQDYLLDLKGGKTTDDIFTYAVNTGKALDIVESMGETYLITLGGAASAAENPDNSALAKELAGDSKTNFYAQVGNFMNRTQSGFGGINKAIGYSNDFLGTDFDKITYQNLLKLTVNGADSLITTEAQAETLVDAGFVAPEASTPSAAPLTYGSDGIQQVGGVVYNTNTGL